MRKIQGTKVLKRLKKRHDRHSLDRTNRSACFVYDMLVWKKKNIDNEI